MRALSLHLPLIIVPVVLAWTQGHPSPLEAGDECQEDQATQLLQTSFRALRSSAAEQPLRSATPLAPPSEQLAKDRDPLPALRPWGHSYYSSDPRSTAHYLTRYFKKSRLTQYESSAFPCRGEKAVVEYCPEPGQPCMVQILVRDPRMTRPESGHTGWTLNPDNLVNVSNGEFSRVANMSMRGASTFSAWVDFHDGWRSEDFDRPLFLADGAGYQQYTLDLQPTHLVRVGLPGTMWTLELHYTYQTGDPLLAETFPPDACRNYVLDATILREFDRSKTGNGWWKTTYAAPDPTTAADFVIQALGAERMVNPFPPVKVPGCAFADWVVLRNHSQSPPGAAPGFMLHFVQQSSIWPPGEVTVTQFASQQEENRDLEAGVFDVFMYNSIILWADTLDPFVLRLQAMGAPFIPVALDDEFALFVDIPKNGIVLQLRSKVLTAVAARSVDACL